MPTVVIRVDPERREWWKELLSDLLPEYSVYLWDEDAYDKSLVDYAVVWNPPLGGLAALPNLKCVFSVGAGVSHILRDPDYPTEVPIVRTVSADLRKRMTEYVLLHVLRVHRRLREVEQASLNHEWVQYVEPLAKDITVGLLGVGNLGAAAGQALASVGYRVLGWSRRGRPAGDAEVFTGQQGLEQLLGQSDIVLSMLPETSSTTNLLDGDRFAQMKAGAYFINVGRGQTVVDADLIASLKSGHLAGATLDVFREEPLPSQSEFWTLDNVLITCHTASAIEPATGGKVIADHIVEFESTGKTSDTIDLEQGY